MAFLSQKEVGGGVVQDGWFEVLRAGSPSILQGLAGGSRAELQPRPGVVCRGSFIAASSLSAKRLVYSRLAGGRGLVTLGDYNLFRQIRCPWEWRPNKR